MKNYDRQEIRSLVTRFENKTLPENQWTHEVHLIVAIWYCCNYHFEFALNLMRYQIKSYNLAIGQDNSDTGGYHETITRFWLSVAHEFVEESDAVTITATCNEFLESVHSDREYIKSFYSMETLLSSTSRRKWVAPDLSYTAEDSTSFTLGEASFINRLK